MFHGVTQEYVDRTKGKNKFLYICSLLGMRLDGIQMPENVTMPELYWHYEKHSEKMADILLHIQTIYHGMYCVYENHAGCERGYFRTKKGGLVTLPKKDKNRNDISSELRKYVNDDIQLSAIIEYMGYDEGVLHEHEGNVFFVNESNWLIARLVNHMTGEIVQDDIILDSGSITDVLNSRDAFFDYIFGTENH